MKGAAYLRFTASVFLVFLALWLGAKALSDGEAGYRIVTAEQSSASDEILLAGVIVREEAAVLAEGDYFILPAEGQWLSCGDAVAVKRSAAATYFDFRRHESERESLNYSGSGEELFCALSLSKNRESQRSCVRAAELFLFGAEEKESEHIPPPRELITAESSGYFSRYCDGYEGLSVHGDFSAETSLPENCVGKIVSGDFCCFVAEVDAETADKLSVGAEVTLDGCPASVEEIAEGKAVFRLRRGLPAHLTDRETSLTLTLSRYEGISVPKGAVLSGDGENYIRILRIGGEERLSVELIYDGGDFCIVSGEGLVSGMKIILP